MNRNRCADAFRRNLPLVLCVYTALVEPACARRESASAEPAGPELNAKSGELLPVPASGLRFDSEYSRILVREQGTVRTLYFVDDQGRERIESRMDVARPELLLVPYTRAMLTSYLFVPAPTRVLLIGVGAGSMVRFWEHHEPSLRVEAVDIDPEVLRIAREYFGTRSSQAVQLIAADGFDYLRTTEARYDVIYLDAFLKPSEGTDETGVPSRLKTIETYKEMQTRLRENGVVVINLHYPTLERDVAELRQAFAQTYLFRVPKTGNYILVGASEKRRFSAEELTTVGSRADSRLGASFSIAGWVEHLQATPSSPLRPARR